jgi:uncharacterized protein (DUF3820 family)
MPEIVCGRCGAVNCYRTESAGVHLKATCTKCHSYIKFLPQGATGETIMPFGLHKDKPLKLIPPDYLIWMYHNNRLKGSIKIYVEDNMELLKQQDFERK